MSSSFAASAIESPPGQTRKIPSNGSTNNRFHKGFQLDCNGVRLKHFERVLTDLLPVVRPDYVCLPSPRNLSPKEEIDENELDPSIPMEWPFSQLPASARVFGNNPGQLPNKRRADRKEGQLRSMLRCILHLIPSSAMEKVDRPNNKVPFTIVDFGGGSGHLGIPLALLLPHCRIIVVDLRKRSLDLMHEKARHVVKEVTRDVSSQDTGILMPTSMHAKTADLVKQTELNNDAPLSCCGSRGVLTNLFSFHGPVQEYCDVFDMALALHLCGDATDIALRKAVKAQATSIVIAPCCVGKLSRKVQNPDIFIATGQNASEVSYPQSSTFCQVISNPNDWDALAKAADYSNEQEVRTNRNATRRIAKALLETDRRLFLENKFKYRTAMMRMDPWEVTPKNDIIVAWKEDKIRVSEGVFVNPDNECEADLQVAEAQLLIGPTSNSSLLSSSMISSDWSSDEEAAIRKEIENFLEGTNDENNKMDQVFVSPTRMGSRKRKLIHFVAGKFDLAHWSVGEKDGEKTVAVARRGQRRLGSVA